MTGQSAAELLITIGADPTSAETSIQQFRTNFSSSLSGVSSDLAQWSAQGTANFSVVDQTAQTLSDHFNVNVDAVTNILDRNQQKAQLWKTQLVANLTEVLNTSQNLSIEFGKSFMQFDSALGANIANAILWQTSIGAAFSKAATQAITSIAQQSLVQAIQSAALGFYLLAIQDYSGAAAAFESAAMYGAVGGAAALAGRAIAGGGSGADAGSRGTQSSFGNRASAAGAENSAYGAQLAPGASGSNVARGGVTVIFQGPVYGGQQGLNELANHISRGVEQGTLSVKATVAQRVGGVGR
ncbi:MAG: hypothetical protein ABSB82_02525 [Terriglobia bacterium]|jgi:hypothetical protein